MKKRLIVLTVLVLLLSACTGPTRHDDILFSLGHYESGHFYTSGGFQDYTDYAKYKYEEPQVEGNPYLKPITEETLAEFKSYLENFEKWVVASGEGDPDNELFTCYDFNDALITEDDYLFIENRVSTDDEDFKYSNYNLYFFDMGTNTLHYFHNNT